MGRTIDFSDIEDATDLDEDELLFVVQREGTTALPNSIGPDFFEDVDLDEVREKLVAEPSDEPKLKKKGKKRAAAKAEAKAEAKTEAKSDSASAKEDTKSDSGATKE